MGPTGSLGREANHLVLRGLVILELMTFGFFSLHRVQFTFCAKLCHAVFPQGGSSTRTGNYLKQFLGKGFPTVGGH